ncbi:MAG: hypothetical protein ABR968_14830 [Bacteroidales bacterium]|jgi:hypothetical protein
MFLRKSTFILFISILLFSWSSCDLKVAIPSYIHIDNIAISTQAHPEYGSSSSKITDAWVYVDDQIIGAFELPATIPILQIGMHTVKINAGIKVDGISALRSIYPFYQPYTENMNLVAGINNAITVNPILTYSSATVFQWEENFESAGISINKTHFSDTTINRTLPDDPRVFEGHYSGLIDLDATHTYFEGETIKSYYLPNGSDPVFLEMNYKTNQSFDVGLYALMINGSDTTFEKLSILTIAKSNTWNKIYVNLNTAINSNTISANHYQVYFEVAKNDTVAYPEVLLDNLKLLYQ